MDNELFGQSPNVVVAVILMSIAITLVAYGSFPLIFALTRKKPIAKKKYNRICYIVNLVVMVLFMLLNGNVSSGAPYLLWTWVFSSVGVKRLAKRRLLTDPGENDLEDNPSRRVRFTSCGYQSRDYFEACPKCGKFAKEYVSVEDYPDSRMCQVCGAPLPANAKLCSKCGIKTELRFCSSCGAALIDNASFCGKCGAPVK